MKKVYIICGLLFVLFLSLFVFVNRIYSSYNEFPFITKSHFLNEDEPPTEILSQLFEHEGIRFTTEKVENRDNFWKIAKRYNVNIDTLIGCNYTWTDMIARINQKIIIPSEKGILHFINDISELKQLEKKYEIPAENILLQKLPDFFNQYYEYLDNPNQLVVFIKDAKPLVENMTEKLAKQFTIREMFRSPLGGRMSSFFGTRRHPIFKKRRLHNGLDIAAPYGRLVGVARPGRVVAAGWMGGYGKAVIIQHDHGYKTLYGHLSRIFVRKGQYIKGNRALGRVGSTGWSTGPHLHFTLWKNNKLINPLKVLW